MRFGQLAAVITATVIGGAIRISTLDLQSFWDDEAFTVTLVRLGFVDMLQEVPETERSPHLYYILAWVWAQIFGTGEIGLRSLSALLGTATIPIVYYTARRIGPPRAAAIAAFLVAASPLLIWYSQEARTYALFACLSTLSFLAFVRALRGEPGGLSLWALVASLTIASHYFGIFIVVSEAAWLLFSLGVCRRTIGAIGAVAAVAIALSPLAIHQSDGGALALDTGLLTRITQVPVQFLVGYGVSAMFVGKLAIVGSAALVAFAIWLVITRSDYGTRRGAALAGAVALFAVMTPILLAFAVDYLKTLYLVGALPLLAIAIAQGFAATRAGLLAAAMLAAIGLSVAGLVAATPRLQRPDLRSVASALGSATVDRAIVLAPTTRIDVYLERLQNFPSRGREVEEVVFVGQPVKQPGELAVVPRTLEEPFALNGFELSQRLLAERFTIIRFRAPRPHRVIPEELLQASFAEWPREVTSVALQTAAGAQ
jgi:4-amino-4-deoxy-L-arabinose transferase-like glycosyltransferase